MIYDNLMISVLFNIVYYYYTYRVFHSEMAEGRQRGRQPTHVSSSKQLIHDNVVIVYVSPNIIMLLIDYAITPHVIRSVMVSRFC